MSRGGQRNPSDAPSDDGSAPGVNSVPAPSGRFARLTHTQWENSVRDLLRLDATSGLSQTFPSDARTAGFLFDNHELSLEVDQVLAGAYASAAESLAARVSGDAALLGRLVPPDTGTERERVRAFIAGFGERAFRRPLDATEVESFASLFELGKSSYDDATGFSAGIRMLIEAFLRSPFFLYRVESSTEASGATIPLSGYEVAQRLSFLFTNSIPDDTLLEAARARRDRNSIRGITKASFLDFLERDGGFAYGGWCGDAKCEADIKEETKATIRCLPDEEFRSPETPTTCMWCGRPAVAEAVWARAY